MTEDPKPKIRVSVVLWWIYVLAVLVVLVIVAQRVYPTLATDYRLTWFETFCVSLLPAFACTIPGFFLRRLRLGQMMATFITVVVVGLISLAVAKYAFEKKITDEANRLAGVTNAFFIKVSAPLVAPPAPPVPAVPLSLAITPTPSITPTPIATPTPSGPTPRPAAGQTPTPTPTPTPVPTLPPYDAAQVKGQLTTIGSFEIDTLRAEYQRDIIAAGSARLLDPERLGSDRKMEAGKKSTEALLALNDQFREKERAWIDAQMPKLDLLYIPDAERAGMKKGFLTSSTRARGLVDNFWNAEKKFLGEVNNVFKMLGESNAWSVANGKFAFNDAGFASDLNLRLIKLQALGVEREQTLVDSQTALKQTQVDMFTAGAAAAVKAAADAQAAAEAAAAAAAAQPPGTTPAPGAAAVPVPAPPAPPAAPVTRAPAVPPK